MIPSASSAGRATAAASALTALLSLTFLPDVANGHGYMKTPRSRNWYANEEGVNEQSPAVGKPITESCPHCLNNNLGVCGKVSNGGRSYDPFLDSTGAVMPWISQGTYNEGEIILVESYLDTHHNGHMEIRACSMGLASTQACFDTPGNELTFVSDITSSSIVGGMPADPNYPERGMYAGGQGGGLKNFAMLFQLPDGVSGDVMLQWKYITANSCSPPGYAEYMLENGIPNSFWTPGLTLCTPPYPNDGTRGTTWPEQFFNCAEVTVTPAAPTPSPAPTVTHTPTAVAATSAPDASPVAANPTAPTGGPACCTRDFKTCNIQLEGWCSENEGYCVNSCHKWWLPNGAVEGCTARYEPCSSDAECCSPGTCIGGQCELDANSPTPAVSPTPPAPPSSGGPACCTQNFAQCFEHCGTTQSECENCGQEVYWIEVQQTSCQAKWDACTNNVDGCCNGLTCVEDNPNYSQCRYVESDPTLAPTSAPVAPTTSSPTSGPVPAPPTAPGGCYSNNYKDCNHPDLSDPTSCTTVWLPLGAQENCVALWGECTGQNDEGCCGTSVCHGDSSYGQCVEPPELPTRRNMIAADAGAADADADSGSDDAAASCVVCDDVATRDMVNNGLNCTSHNAMDDMCVRDANWLLNRFCRFSCFNAGYGYEGDNCCNADGAAMTSGRALRKMKN